MTLLEVVQARPWWMEDAAQVVMLAMGCLAFIKAVQEFIRSGIERLQIKENGATDRAKNQALADADRAKHLSDVEAEKAKLLAEVEIEKAKQKAIGAAEVVKIWEHTQNIQKDFEELKTTLQNEIDEVKEVQAGEVKNRDLVKQVFERLQKDMDNVMKAFFDTFKPR